MEILWEYVYMYIYITMWVTFCYNLTWLWKPWTIYIVQWWITHFFEFVIFHTYVELAKGSLDVPSCPFLSVPLVLFVFCVCVASCCAAFCGVSSRGFGSSFWLACSFSPWSFRAISCACPLPRGLLWCCFVVQQGFPVGVSPRVSGCTLQRPSCLTCGHWIHLLLSKHPETVASFLFVFHGTKGLWQKGGYTEKCALWHQDLEENIHNIALVNQENGLQLLYYFIYSNIQDAFTRLESSIQQANLKCSVTNLTMRQSFRTRGPFLVCQSKCIFLRALNFDPHRSGNTIRIHRCSAGLISSY